MKVRAQKVKLLKLASFSCVSAAYLIHFTVLYHSLHCIIDFNVSNNLEGEFVTLYILGEAMVWIL